jgi:hypothetical protein
MCVGECCDLLRRCWCGNVSFSRAAVRTKPCHDSTCSLIIHGVRVHPDSAVLESSADPDLPMLNALASETRSLRAEFCNSVAEVATVAPPSLGASGSVVSLLHAYVRLEGSPALLREAAAWCMHKLRAVCVCVCGVWCGVVCNVLLDDRCSCTQRLKLALLLNLAPCRKVGTMLPPFLLRIGL